MCSGVLRVEVTTLSCYCFLDKHVQRPILVDSKGACVSAAIDLVSVAYTADSLSSASLIREVRRKLDLCPRIDGTSAVLDRGILFVLCHISVRNVGPIVDFVGH